MDGNPTFYQFIAWKLGKAMDRSIANRAKRASRAGTISQTILRLFLHIVGFSCLTFAGFLWNPAAGLVVAGISCFVLSALLTTSAPDQTQQNPQR